MFPCVCCPFVHVRASCASPAGGFCFTFYQPRLAIVAVYQRQSLRVQYELLLPPLPHHLFVFAPRQARGGTTTRKGAASLSTRRRLPLSSMRTERKSEGEFKFALEKYRHRSVTHLSRSLSISFSRSAVSFSSGPSAQLVFGRLLADIVGNMIEASAAVARDDEAGSLRYGTVRRIKPLGLTLLFTPAR